MSAHWRYTGNQVISAELAEHYGENIVLEVQGVHAGICCSLLLLARRIHVNCCHA